MNERTRRGCPGAPARAGVLLLACLASGAAAPPVARVVDVCEALPGGPPPCRSFLEGPAVDAAGDVYFSDEPRDRILSVSPASGRVVERHRPARRANGMTFDREGRLVVCEGASPGGGRSVARYERDGTRTVLAHSYRGAPLNSPNDLVIDARGRVWFTDPRYGGGPPVEQDAEAVYRIEAPDPPPGEDANDSVVRVLGRSDVTRPNGIALSPDQRTLYVADTDTGAGGVRRLVAFALDPEDRPGPGRLIHDFGDGTGADGLRVDVAGYVYAAAGALERGDAAIQVFDPRRPGEPVSTIPVPETPSNLAFGGPEGRTLYVTATRSLYRARVPRPGFVVYPRWSE